MVEFKWVYVRDTEKWLEIKEKYVRRFKSHKAAAEHCNIPFHTFRRIGKTSNWIPRVCFDAILKKTGRTYRNFNGAIAKYTQAQKDLIYHEQAMESKKKIYGDAFFSNLGFKKWENTPRKERRAHSQKMCLKAMREEKIKELISKVSKKCDIDQVFLEYCFSSYRNHGMEDLLVLSCSEEEINVLEVLKEGEMLFSKLLEKSGMDATKVNEAVHNLYTKGIITVKVPFTNNPQLRNDKITCKINEEGVKAKLREYCETKIEELNHLEKETDGGYFVCEKDNNLVPLEEVLKNDYKCPKCHSNVIWVKDEELSIALDVTNFVLNKVDQMAMA